MAIGAVTSASYWSTGTGSTNPRPSGSTISVRRYSANGSPVRRSTSSAMTHAADVRWNCSCVPGSYVSRHFAMASSRSARWSIFG